MSSHKKPKKFAKRMAGGGMTGDVANNIASSISGRTGSSGDSKLSISGGPDKPTVVTGLGGATGGRILGFAFDGSGAKVIMNPSMMGSGGSSGGTSGGTSGGSGLPIKNLKKKKKANATSNTTSNTSSNTTAVARVIKPYSSNWKEVVGHYFPTRSKAGGLMKKAGTMKKPMKKMAAGGKVRGGGAATKGLKISKKMG